VSCENLQPEFDAARRRRDLAELVDKHASDCACETGKVSTFDDGRPVTDEEHLLRIVLAPRDRTDTSPLSFADTFVLPIIGVGFSVLRESQASPDEIVRLANELATSAADALPPSEVAEIIGVVRFQARLVRERRTLADGTANAARRAICVYATPDQVYPSHADLLLAVTRFGSKTKCRKEAFAFSAQLEPLFIKAADFTTVNIAGIRFPGRKIN
jgi:hypothetical protein